MKGTIRNQHRSARPANHFGRCNTRLERRSSKVQGGKQGSNIIARARKSHHVKRFGQIVCNCQGPFHTAARPPVPVTTSRNKSMRNDGEARQPQAKVASYRYPSFCPGAAFRRHRPKSRKQLPARPDQPTWYGHAARTDARTRPMRQVTFDPAPSAISRRSRAWPPR